VREAETVRGEATRAVNAIKGNWGGGDLEHLMSKWPPLDAQLGQFGTDLGKLARLTNERYLTRLTDKDLVPQRLAELAEEADESADRQFAHAGSSSSSDSAASSLSRMSTAMRCSAVARTIVRSA